MTIVWLFCDPIFRLFYDYIFLLFYDYIFLLFLRVFVMPLLSCVCVTQTRVGAAAGGAGVPRERVPPQRLQGGANVQLRQQPTGPVPALVGKLHSSVHVLPWTCPGHCTNYRELFRMFRKKC